MLKQGKSRHAQISDWILDEIESGRLKTDDKLPSENDLADKFDVSRVTVRRALQTLESDAVIYRCQGLGSFVGDKRTPQTLVRLTDFNQDMMQAGLMASSKVIETILEPASALIAENLGVEVGTMLFRIDRLRLGDGDPVAYDITWLPVVYGHLLDAGELEKTTIYEILEKKYQIPVTRGCYRISAVGAESNVAEALKIPEKSALLQIDRISYTVGGKPIYYQKRFYRSDKVVYEMRLEREENADNNSDLPLKEFVPVFPSKKPAPRLSSQKTAN